MATKTNNEYFSGTNAGSKVLEHLANHVIVSVTGTMSIGFDGTNYMPLTAGNHEFYYVNVKTVYFSGTGTWSGFGVGN
jgi:hypothetical protein